MEVKEGKRWSGADWADQQSDILLIGAGGIGSWTALALSRIEHRLTIIDPDMVDTTNVEGGQMYRVGDVGEHKVNAVLAICREFGCNNRLTVVADRFTPEKGTFPITIMGVDNMVARRDGFETWSTTFGDNKEALFIDGRLLMETCEVFTIKGGDLGAIKEYKEKWLFKDSEVEDLDCTNKQSTFAAMTIAGMITGTLCNFLTNKKLQIDFREVPFHQRMYFPILNYKTEEYGDCKINQEGKAPVLQGSELRIQGEPKSTIQC